jgi:hypothetical protein
MGRAEGAQGDEMTDEEFEKLLIEVLRRDREKSIGAIIDQAIRERDAITL